MADKPIVFSAPMVRALLDGRKTQTRRVIKQPAALDALAVFGPTFLTLPGNVDYLRYALGDRLYVREAFYKCDACEYICSAVDANSAGINDRKCCTACDAMLPKAAKHSIYMPRHASRLTLIVTDVRVQRLQDITEADAVAEGAIPVAVGGFDADDQPHSRLSYCDGYSLLWNSLHGPKPRKRAGGHLPPRPTPDFTWDANPWVAAIGFTVHHCNIDQMGVAQ